MTNPELLTFLDNKRWTNVERKVLIDEWNSRRTQTSVGRIGVNHVRTPCRLKDVISSMKKYVQAEMSSENVVT